LACKKLVVQNPSGYTREQGSPQQRRLSTHCDRGAVTSDIIVF